MFLAGWHYLVYNMKNDPCFSLYCLPPQTADELSSADTSECHKTWICCLVCGINWQDVCECQLLIRCRCVRHREASLSMTSSCCDVRDERVQSPGFFVSTLFVSSFQKTMDYWLEAATIIFLLLLMRCFVFFCKAIVVMYCIILDCIKMWCAICIILLITATYLYHTEQDNL